MPINAECSSRMEMKRSMAFEESDISSSGGEEDFEFEDEDEIMEVVVDQEDEVEDDDDDVVVVVDRSGPGPSEPRGASGTTVEEIGKCYLLKVGLKQ